MRFSVGDLQPALGSLEEAHEVSNAEIASMLVVERCTVRKHLENVHEKLGLRSRTAALEAVRV